MPYCHKESSGPRTALQGETFRVFSQTAEYALRAMAWLALSPEKRVPSSIIAEKTQVPGDYLAKVLQLLGEAGFIEGRRGVRGGYRLTMPAVEINLLDVINAVSRDEMQLKPIETCPLKLENHGPNLCPLHKTMDEAIAAIISVLGNRTLADLVDANAETKPLCDAQTTAKLTITRP